MQISDPYLVPNANIKSAFEAMVPGSKSLTNRAVIAAALCEDKVNLVRPLISEDTDVASAALAQLGVKFEKSDHEWVIDASGWSVQDQIDAPNLYLANAGTAVRFLSAVLAAKSMNCRVHGSQRMHERPIELLLKGLSDLGANIQAEKDNGCPPIHIKKSDFVGGKTVLSGQVSSQFFSGLMMACPFAKNESIIEVSDQWLSKPYIEMTASMLRDFGIEMSIGKSSIIIPGQQTYKSPGVYHIEPDASAATYPIGLAVIHGIPVTLKGLGTNSLQGDVRYHEVLQAMGCKVVIKSNELSITPPEKLKAIQMDLNHIPDAAMTVVVLCAIAKGQSRLSGLRNLAFKECDRLKALETELQKIGADVVANEDGFVIHGRSLSEFHGAEIETYKDHRMAMCLSLLGTKVSEMNILNPMCVTKTYPNYWEDLNDWLGLI